MRVSSLLAGTAIAFASAASALPKIHRAGKYLYAEDGTRFFVKGVAYQEQGIVTTDDEFQEQVYLPDSFIDPLATPDFCSRDLPYLTQLGINAVRVYSVDPRNNHDDCMRMFNDAGIYTIIDLSQPLNGSIDRDAPRWSSNLMNLYLTTVDTFSKYENVLAYTVGNEIVRDVPSSASAPFIKAAVRDVKAYIKSKGYSQLVTYATTDGSGWRNPLVTYLTCGDEATTVDLIGLNNYQWKGDSSIAAYGATNEFFSTINVPAYFSEYGSPASPPRLFTEVDALFGTEMSAIWSGGLAFAYFQSIQQGFGLVDLSEDGKTITPNADFTALQTHYQAVTFATTPSEADAGATQYPACPTPDVSVFVGSANLPPTPNQSACDCAVNDAFPCVFSPRTVNTSAVIGPLFNFACEQLGNAGSDACEALSANGTTGTYGVMSSCDPASQLSYVFSAFYESNNQDAASCSFNGNATLNANAPTTADAASKAAESCLANARNVYTPTGPSTPAQTTTGGAKPTGTNGGGKGDDSAMRSSYSFVAVGVSMAFAFIGALVVF